MRVAVAARATKVVQLIGDDDKGLDAPVGNQTYSRFQLSGTDLGIPFKHKDRTYLLFGDSAGGNGGDAIAYTTDDDPGDGIELEFLHDAGTYRPIKIPGISQGDFEVPTEGVSIGGRMYIYHTTDASDESRLAENGGYRMGRSVVAVSDDDGHSFGYLYDLSHRYFINVSIVQTDGTEGTGLQDQLLLFGSGAYRQSNVYLASQPAAEIGSPLHLRYWSGVDPTGRPLWSTREDESRPLFDQPCVGELSVSYNRFVRKWIMLYNCDLGQRGIHMRTADQPWGPWSEPQIIFDPWADKAYCDFIHVSWSVQQCDQLSGPGFENVWGGEYGPFQFEELATGDNASTTIYFTMSTWNPYTVVLMKAVLQLSP